MTKQSNKKFSVGLGIIAVLIVLCLVLNMVLVQYKGDISLALAGVSEGGLEGYTLEDLQQMGHEANVKQEEEGAILLQNNNNALPLTGDKITLLGYCSYAYTLGNTSGASAGKAIEDITMLDAFNSAGLSVNSTGWDTLATALRKPGHLSSSGGSKEVEVSTYQNAFTDSVLGSYTDAAVITIGRLGGEGASIEQADLQLSQNEQDLISWAKTKFGKVVVLINSPNVMELGPLEELADAVLWIGTTGTYGMEGVGNILAGKVSPSGRTVDTWAYDFYSAPAFYNVNNNQYANYNQDIVGATMGFYQYEEGIYVGYRWYETADAVGYWDDVDNGYGTGYDGVVQYPFGYGLSYTSFTQEIVDSSIDLTAHTTGNSVTVKVTNTGSVAGKEVVQLYLTAPYDTDPTCGINDGASRVPLEKSAKVLIGFAKTETLEAGASEEVTITFDTDELASYDVFGHNCYVLERGEYVFTIGENAHVDIESVSADLAETVVFNESGVGARSSDETVATNVLDDVTAGDGVWSADLASAYLSRSDFKSGMEKIMQYDQGSMDETVSEELLAVLSLGGLQSADYTYPVYKDGKLTYETSTYYLQGARQEAYAETNYCGESMNSSEYAVTVGDSSKLGDLTIEDLKDASYDDERWEAILDALTLDELLTWQSAHDSSPALESISKEQGIYVDGACKVGADKAGYDTTWFCAACVTASSWNVDLATEVSTAYALQAAYYNVVGVYAPSMDIHRTAVGGRNIEYYSEDGFISGKIGAAQVSAIQAQGIMVFLKHCLLNDNDTNRSGAITFLNEQAMREIYALPYEISVKEGGALGIMGALNRIGITWAHPGFYLSMLRDEWGYKGLVITDMATSGSTFMSPNVAVLSGIAMLKGDKLTSSNWTSYDGSTLSNYSTYMLREVAHYGLYQYVNSRAFDAAPVVPNKTWYIGWIALDVVLAAAIVLVYVFMVNRPLIEMIKSASAKKATAGEDSDEEDSDEED